MLQQPPGRPVVITEWCLGPAVNAEMIEYRSAGSAVPSMALGCIRPDVSESARSASRQLVFTPYVVCGETLKKPAGPDHRHAYTSPSVPRTPPTARPPAVGGRVMLRTRTAAACLASRSQASPARPGRASTAAWCSVGTAPAERPRPTARKPHSGRHLLPSGEMGRGRAAGSR
jgi:hypothetical protein